MKHAELIARLEAAEMGGDDLDDAVSDAAGVTLSYSWTTSLDCALALAERVLPLGSWRIEREGAVFWAKIWWDREGKAGHKYADAKTPALALCIAILKALEAKQCD
jgi:hypothetical protein